MERPTLVLRAEADIRHSPSRPGVLPARVLRGAHRRDRLVIEVLALPNTTEEGPRRRFLVRPADYQAAERRATELGVELLGFYHSHPDHPARPSQHDLDHAWPVFAYVIVAVDGGEPRVMTSWRLREDRSAFDEEPVAVEPGDGQRKQTRESRRGPKAEHRRPELREA